MGMRVVQESLASCVPGRLAFSEICEAFLEQVLCKHLKKSSQKRQGRTWPGREHGLPGAFGKDAGSWGALNMRRCCASGVRGHLGLSLESQMEDRTGKPERRPL